MNTIKSIFIGLLIIIFCASPIVSAQAEKQEAPEASSKLETSVNKKTPQSPKTLRIIGHAKGQEGLEVFYKDHIKEFRFRHPDVEITYVDGKDLDLGTSFCAGGRARAAAAAAAGRRCGSDGAGGTARSK